MLVGWSDVMLADSQQEVKNRGAISRGGLEMTGREESVEKVLSNFTLLRLNLQLHESQLRKEGATSVHNGPIEAVCSFCRFQVHHEPVTEHNLLTEGGHVEEGLETVAKHGDQEASILGKRKVVEDDVCHLVCKEDQPDARNANE